MSNIISNTIRLAGIIEESVVDGPGFRFVVFVQGCQKRCVGCHNPQALSLTGGYEENIDNIIMRFKQNPLISGITISGGEPFLQPLAIKRLVDAAKKINLSVMIYSGYYYEELLAMPNDDIKHILKTADYLVDGPFEIEKKDLSLLFRGSSNQRYIDLVKTKNSGKLFCV